MLWRARDVVTQVSMTRPCPQGVLTWKECDVGAGSIDSCTPKVILCQVTGMHLPVGLRGRSVYLAPCDEMFDSTEKLSYLEPL